MKRALWHQHPHVRTGSDLTFGERAADRLKAAFGSWAFLITLNVVIGGWIVLNSLQRRPFDPYPFILLNLGLSWLAAQQGGALQIAANRGDRIASEVALTTQRSAAELVEMNRQQLAILEHLDGLDTAVGDLADAVRAVVAASREQPRGVPRPRPAATGDDKTRRT